MSENVKPQAGAYGNMSNEEYPDSIKFEVNIPVVATFKPEYKEPEERANKDNDGVFYIFPVVVKGEDKSIMTSAWSLLRKLKEKEPLAGNTYIITKKLIGSKQEFFVEEESSVPKEVESVQA